MLELSPARKNKINLLDYNSQQDIQNRILMSDFSPFDLEVLEEILFSPLKISLKKLGRTLGCSDEALLPIVQKVAKTGLLTLQDDSISVDKEMRKYFEFQIQRFDSDFKPDMEFVQGLLRKVPIHVLPAWYSIPRSSNNIFESIVEKYLFTPQIFQRYLQELNFGEPVIQGILRDVFSASDFRISSSDLISKYNLARTDFEEIMLLLEFNFVCCVSYVKEDDHWLEIVTPFYEWHQYLRFLKETEAHPIETPETISRKRDNDYAFVEDMASLLQLIRKRPQPLDPLGLSENMAAEFAALCHISLETATDLPFARNYFAHLIDKLRLVKLANLVDSRLYALDSANDWLDMSLENRALFLYRHPLNQMISTPQFPIERGVREAERSIKRVLHGRWVYFDDFIRSSFVPLNEESVVVLKKTGKHWKYTLPTYSEAEKGLIKATVFEWLFEAGIVAIGTHQNRDCFCVTPFGKFFFED
jgi:hypothetical protein